MNLRDDKDCSSLSCVCELRKARVRRSAHDPLLNASLVCRRTHSPTRLMADTFLQDPSGISSSSVSIDSFFSRKLLLSVLDRPDTPVAGRDP